MALQLKGFKNFMDMRPSRLNVRVFVGAMFFCLQFGLLPNAFAEKADRLKALEWEAALQSSLPKQGDVEGISLDGKVVITQGTLKIKADKLVIKQDKDGARFGEGTGAPVFFTQKQEGSSEYFEGVAERLEFDERTNTIKLFAKAKLKLGKDEFAAEYILYNTETEAYQSTGVLPGSKLPANSGLARGTLFPKAKVPTETPKLTAPAGTGSPAKPATAN